MNIQGLLWRIDGLRGDVLEAMKLEQIRVAMRTLATESLSFRKVLSITQPAGQPVVMPYRGVDAPSFDVERIFAIIDTTENPAGVELEPCDGMGIPSLHAPALISFGTPTRFVPLQGFAVLNRKPSSNRSFRVLCALVPGPDLDSVPMTTEQQEAVVHGAGWLILRLPGKQQDIRLSEDMRKQFYCAAMNLRGKYALSMAGLPTGLLLQMPTIMDPESVTASAPPDGGGGDNGGGDNNGGGTGGNPVTGGWLVGAPLGDGGTGTPSSDLQSTMRSTADAAQVFDFKGLGIEAIGWYFQVDTPGFYTFAAQYGDTSNDLTATINLFDESSNPISGTAGPGNTITFELFGATPYVITVRGIDTQQRRIAITQYSADNPNNPI